MRAGAVIAILALVTTACGSGSKSTSSSKSRSSSASTQAANGNSASVSSGPVHAALTGENHAPVAKQLWSYSVRVTDASGHPLNGSVAIQFTFEGNVVGHDTPPVHPVKNGLWHDMLTFPNQAIGEPLELQAVVHTAGGSVTLNWPVTVRP